jgi:hypothetical protein
MQLGQQQSVAEQLAPAKRLLTPFCLLSSAAKIEPLRLSVCDIFLAANQVMLLLLLPCDAC